MERLTELELRVLTSLLAAGRNSEKELSDRLGMAPSNFSAVKKRLVERGVLLEEMRVNIHNIEEAQLTGFVWIEYNQPIRDRYEHLFRLYRARLPVAMTLGSKDWSLNFDYFRTLEEAEAGRLDLAEKLRDQGLAPFLSVFTWKNVPMPLHTLRRAEARLVRYFAKGETGGEVSLERDGDAKPEITLSERKVLVALRRFPGSRLSDMAKRAGMAQSTMSECLRSLREKNVISNMWSLDPRRLPGVNNAVMAWVELAQPLIGKACDELAEKWISETPQLWRLHYSPLFFCSVEFFESLDRAEEHRLRLLELFGERLGVLRYKVVPIQHLQLEYTPYFLERLFGINLVPPGTPLERQKS